MKNCRPKYNILFYFVQNCFKDWIKLCHIHADTKNSSSYFSLAGKPFWLIGKFVMGNSTRHDVFAGSYSYSDKEYFVTLRAAKSHWYRSRMEDAASNLSRCSILLSDDEMFLCVLKSWCGDKWRYQSRFLHHEGLHFDGRLWCVSRADILNRNMKSFFDHYHIVFQYKSSVL